MRRDRNPALGGFLRAKLETLRERLEQTRADFLQRFDQIDSEIDYLETEIGKDAGEFLEIALEKAAVPKTALAPPQKIVSLRIIGPQPSVSAIEDAKRGDLEPIEEPELELLAPQPSPAHVEADEEEVGAAEALKAPPEAPPAIAPTLESLGPPAGEAPPAVEGPEAKEAQVVFEAARSQFAAITAPEPEKPFAQPLAPLKPKIDWEALIGASWLNIIGIVILVIGMALLTEHTLRQFGPVGRVGTGIAVGLGLLLTGVLLERIEERYKILARTLMGGGWAVLYFIAYAAHNVDAARVVANPVVGLAVMMVIAAGMILHSLTFRSQLVTGLAYGLGFVAVGLAPVTTDSLAACAILAASQVVILRLFDWQTLALVAVVGSYLNHWRWLDRLVTASQENGAALLAPDQHNYWLSLGILGFYWILMVITSLFRNPSSEREKLVQLTVSIANTVGMLGVSALQIIAFKDQDLYLLAAAATPAYGAAAYASWRAGRRDLFRFNSAVAGLLYAATLPLALKPLSIDHAWLSVYWLAGGALGLLIGVRLREVATRAEAYLLCGAAVGVALAIHPPGAPSAWLSAQWWLGPVTALGLLVLSEGLQRAARDGRLVPLESALTPVWGYVSVVIFSRFAYEAFDPEYLGLILIALGLPLFETGADATRFHLRAQGYLLFAGGALQILGVNLAGAATQPLWITAAPAAPALYYVSWRLRDRALRSETLDWLGGQGAGWAATLIISLLFWREVDHALVALVWLAYALALFELGALTRQDGLRLQSHMLRAAAFATLIVYDLAETAPETWLPRWAIVAAGASVYYYVSWRMIAGSASWRNEVERYLADAHSFAGSALIAALAWRELDASIVALVWLAYAVLLFELGVRASRGALRLQAYLLTAISFAHLVQTGLSESAAPTLAPVSLVLVIGAFVHYYFDLRLTAPKALAWRSAAETDFADVPSFAGSALLAIVLWREAEHDVVGLAWLAFAAALFEVGLLWARGALRVQSYSLSLTALLALLAFDVLDAPAASPSELSGQTAIVLASAAAYHFFFWRLNIEVARGRARAFETSVGDLLSFAGTGLLAAFVWQKANPALVAPLWLALALPLFEIGAWRRKGVLRLQAYLLFAGSFVALFAINLYELFPQGVDKIIIGPRSAFVGGAAAAYYYLFWRLRAGGVETLQDALRAWLADAPSIAGTALLAVLTWKDGGFASVALGWAVMALALYEAGRGGGYARLALQGHVMSAFAFGRLFTANFIDSSFEPWGLSHRLLTVVPVAALFYFLRAETKAEAKNAQASGIFAVEWLSRLYSWGGALLLVALARFELGRADWIMGLAPLLLVLLILGEKFYDLDFRYQSYVLAVLSFARTWSTNVYLVGDFYALDLPERLVTILPLLIVFTAATAVALRCPKPEPASETASSSRIVRFLQLFDRRADEFFGFLAAVVGLALLYCEVPEGWVTSAWALEALTLIIAGFAASKRSFRYWGLMLLFICVLKLVVLDLRDVEAIYRIVSYIVLGVVLLLASFVYTRHRGVLRKYM